MGQFNCKIAMSFRKIEPKCSLPKYVEYKYIEENIKGKEDISFEFQCHIQILFVSIIRAYDTNIVCIK